MNHVTTMDPTDTLIPTQPIVPYEAQWANAIIDSETGESMEYRQLIKHDKYREVWKRSFANELGRLAQGGGKDQRHEHYFLYAV
jgi:hypothetical protein